MPDQDPAPNPEDTARIDRAEVEKAAREEAARAALPPPRRRINLDFIIPRRPRRGTPPE